MNFDDIFSDPSDDLGCDFDHDAIVAITRAYSRRHADLYGEELSPDDLDDTIQEGLLAAWASHERGDEVDEQRHAAISAARSYLRQLWRVERPETEPETGLDTFPERCPLPLDHAESLRRACAWIAELPPRQGVVAAIILHTPIEMFTGTNSGAGGWTTIGRELGCSRQAVKKLADKMKPKAPRLALARLLAEVRAAVA